MRKRKRAAQSKEMYERALKAKGFGPITTEIRPAPEFYYAEDYHQQYLGQESRRLLRARRHRGFAVRREWRSKQLIEFSAAGLSRSARSACDCRAGARATAPRQDRRAGPSPFETSVYASSVVQAFTELGYAEGARATFLYRFAEGGLRAVPQAGAGAGRARLRSADRRCAREPPARALQFCEPAAPILFLAIDYDPLASGMVTNLRSPDRNTTGVFVPQNALVARRVEIMRELLPQAKRLMVFADAYSADQVGCRAQGCRRCQPSAHAGAVRDGSPTTTAPTCERPARIDADAFMNLASPVFARDRQQIQRGLAPAAPSQHRLQPAAGGGRAIC